MSEEGLCKLCKENRAFDIDLEKSKFKLANKLLQRLFESYKIDVTILGDNSCICEQCFNEVLHITESLERWSKAQKEIQEKPLDIDDSMAFQVKSEVDSLQDEGEFPREDVTDLPDEDQLGQNKELELVEDELFDPTPQDFFSVGLARDGLAITKLFKDKTKTTRMLCTCCDQVLEILSHIRMHSGKARPNPVYYCRECGSGFPKLRELQTHMTTMDHFKTSDGGRDLEFLCLKCHQLFPRFFDVIRHENSVHNSLEYFCMECNMYFKFQRSYKCHVKQHGNMETVFSTADHEPKIYECRYGDCDRRFRVWGRYVQHMKWHKGARNLHCPYPRCKETIQPGHYMMHMNSRHNQNGRFMTIDPRKRVEPDTRQVPYVRSQMRPREFRNLSESLLTDYSGGQFISLDKELTLQQGKYINVDGSECT
ncbi:histone-lysine N-methyltransferase PRDM9 [Drosophila ficusphila]|uniref:histone-lysine N-methyltransferase PRDM9 n=1 Tax=Drosophila ficusphila TaxID=30025 RepID=UPI0007E6B69B|nr:histone-lysine N-methyltransferase PRDM9 [Drosophila ficusphila]